MASLFDIANSGLQSYRKALSVTGQNIGNINTEGFKRREANLEEVTSGTGGVQSSGSQVGLGVRVESIRRSFDTYLQTRVRTSLAQFEKTDTFVGSLKEIENMLLPGDAGLGNFLGNFFASLQAVASAPADNAPRVVATEDGKALANAFRQTHQMLTDVKLGILQEAQQEATLLNELAIQAAKNNAQILSTGQGSSSNFLLDTRDKVIDEISRLAEITSDLGSRGEALIRLGPTGVGLELVSESNSKSLEVFSDDRTLGFSIDGTPTSQVVNGKLKGLQDSYALAAEIISELDQLAFNFVKALNAQHREGVDIDGAQGMDMFGSAGFEVIKGRTNTGVYSVETSVTDINLAQAEDISFSFSKEQNAWIARDAKLNQVASGRDIISLPGVQVQIIGSPDNNDDFTLSPASNYAKNLSFLLTSGDQIAAAAKNLVSSDVANTGDASLQATRLLTNNPAGIPSVSEVMRNSDSVVAGTTFLKDGSAFSIPSNIENLALTSYDSQEQLQFSLSSAELQSASQLNFTIVQPNGTSVDHQFDIRYASVFPGSTGGWTDASEIAKYLNLGTLKNASNQSLQDLGIYVAGSGAQIALALSAGQFSSATNKEGEISAGSASILGTKKSASSSSNIQIFTREGRHIAGTTLSGSEIASLLVKENGFSSSAQYRADYLNSAAQSYRGIKLDRSISGGEKRIIFGSNGSAASAAGAVGSVPASSASAHTLTLNTVSHSTDLSIAAGSSAELVASQINAIANDNGVMARASTRVEFFAPSTSGTATFSIESVNQKPVNVSAQISDTDLTDLAQKINELSGQTGVTATLSADRLRVVLESEAGKDVILSSFSFAGTISSRVVDPRTQSLTSTVTLGQGNNDSARYSGAIELLSQGAFSITTTGNATVNASNSELASGLIKETVSQTGEKSALFFDADQASAGNQAGASGSKVSAASGQFNVSLPSTGSGQAFAATVDLKNLSEISPSSIASEVAKQLRGSSPTTALSGATALTVLPEDKSTVKVSFEGKTYTLEVSYKNASIKTNPDIRVTGGEAGRIEAYFDANNRLQIVAPDGSVNGSQITVPANSVIAGNGDRAAEFGLITSTAEPATILSGRSVSLPTSNQTLAVTVDGTVVNVTLTHNSGAFSISSADTSKLTATFVSTGGTTSTSATDRILLKSNLASPAISVPEAAVSESLGFKVSDYVVTLNSDKLDVARTDGEALTITRSATSPASEKISLSNLPNEELIVMLTGNGARLLSASFDELPETGIDPIENFTVKLMNSEARTIEVFDKDTGHSIANRVLDDNDQTHVVGYEIGLTGRGSDGDQYHIEENIGAVGDGRNALALAALQRASSGKPSGSGFQQIFNDTVTRVGASLRANETSLEAAQAIMEASVDAEAAYSGINLDTEAARLIEQQQAYQASARILQTARELFQTLMDVV